MSDKQSKKGKAAEAKPAASPKPAEAKPAASPKPEQPKPEQPKAEKPKASPAVKAASPKVEPQEPKAAAKKDEKKAAPAAAAAKKDEKKDDKKAAPAGKKDEKKDDKKAAPAGKKDDKKAAPAGKKDDKKDDKKAAAGKKDDKKAAPAAKKDEKKDDKKASVKRDFRPAKTAVAVAKKIIKSSKKTKTIPESMLKKRKTLEELKNNKTAVAYVRRLQQSAKRKELFRRAEKYAKEYRQKAAATVRAQRQAKNNGNYYVPDEAKVAFVVRIRGINGVDPKTRKILQLLRLRQIHNGVFVKLNKATGNMLRLVEPYVTYGTPSLRSIRELVYKRGFGKVNKQRIALTSNNVVEKNLRGLNIICVEDIIHEIFTCGRRFKQVNNFLWPFKLSSPLGGFDCKTTHFAEGGQAGNREELINDLIRRMN